VAAGVLLFAAQWLRCASTKASFLLDHDPVDSVLFAVLLILAVRTLLRHRREKALENLSVTVAGLLYIWFPLAFLFKARNLTGLSTAAGVWAICHLMATAKIGDVGAFFTGKFLGRRKLAPSISPGKTVEGSMGGLAASTLLSVVMCLSVPELRAIYGLLGGIVFGLVVGVLSQAGDLFESHIKRMAGVKNSGDLIPEFGGMLDIVDSLLFSTPVAYFLLVAFH
jgi:phosphatidate cytidylyltransferase